MKNSRFRFVGLILAVLLIAAATHAQVQVVNSLITTFAGGGAGCAGQTDSIGDGCPVADSGLRNPTGLRWIPPATYISSTTSTTSSAR